jgi:hypothetical protein
MKKSFGAKLAHNPNKAEKYFLALVYRLSKTT